MKYALPLEEYVKKVHLEEFLRRQFQEEAEKTANVKNKLEVNKTKEPSSKKSLQKESMQREGR